MADKEDKTTNKEKMEQISAMLEKGVHDLFQTNDYKKYLNVMSKFHDYSFNNTLLIASQRPDATLVAGYQSWQKNFNRHVRKGEKGIKIIAPMPTQKRVKQKKTDDLTGEIVKDADGIPQTEEVAITIPRFRAVTVFDVSQTEGEPLPERPGAEILTAKVDDYSVMMQAIRKISPVPVRFSDEISGTANGFFDASSKEIVIRAGMPEAQTIKTLIHEVVHARLHDPDVLRKQGEGKVDQVTREVQAESVAYVVLQHFGVDSSQYTFPYIGAWSSSVEMQELRESMDLIRQTSAEIIDNLTEHMEAERAPEEAKNMQDSIPSAGFKTSDEISYEIYQICKSNTPYEFMGSKYLAKQGLAVKASDYRRVYQGKLNNVTKDKALDILYRKFNEDQPDDFRGHSLSVSDVVILHHGDKVQAYYIDSFGFKQLPDFVKELQQQRQKQQEEMAKNIECKQAIERAIEQNYDYKSCHLNTTEAVKSVISEYGADRVQYVLAVTVALKDWDGRFSPENKAWAQAITKDDAIEKDGVDKRNTYIIDAHPALLDGFINKARMYNEIEQDKGQTKTVENFAERLDRFSREYDTYEYQDNVASSEQHVHEITQQIQAGNTDGLKDWLHNIITTSDNEREIATAKCLEKDFPTDKEKETHTPERESVLQKLRKNQRKVQEQGQNPFGEERGERCL